MSASAPASIHPHPNARPGAKNHRWRGSERMRSSHGYTRVRVGEGHPLADSEGFAYEHIVVWCAAGNRSPTKEQHLHHKNGDKADNRISNLALVERAEHSRQHAAIQPRLRGRFVRAEMMR